MVRVYSDELKSAVLLARLNGMPFRKIRKTFKISDQTVRMWLREEQALLQPDDKKCTCSKQRKSRFTEQERKDIVHRYENGENINSLCDEFQIGRSTLYRWISLHTEYRRYKGDTITSKEIFALLEENRMLKEENTILHRSRCLPSAPLSEKMKEMEVLKEDFSIRALCRAFDVERPTFYNFLKRAKKPTMYERNDEILRPLIKEIFDASKERFGAEKIRIKIIEQGKTVCIKHIARLMKEMNLVCKKTKLRYFNTTNRNQRYRRNRVLKDFNQTSPNTIWVSDVTYARVHSDFYAICVIIDLFSRRVLSYHISPQNNTALIKRTFCKAFDFRGQPENLIFHSDQGAQYTAYEFRKMLRDLGVKQSFSNPGCPYDNAVAESFFSIMKQEELSHNYYNSLKELEDTVSEYIEFYNTMRPHKRLKGMSPTVFEIKYFSLAEAPVTISNRQALTVQS